MKKLEVLFTPVEFAALKERDLAETVCVVFDVLRATTSMVTALNHGAEAIIPVGEISEALAIHKKQPDVLLAGERNGVKIRATLTGGRDFDLGNSPREFTSEQVHGKIIVTTTTNGTRALRGCADAQVILAASFANLGVTAKFISSVNVNELLLICAGTYEEAAFEDALATGALCDLVWSQFPSESVADSAQIARQIYLSAKNDLSKAVETYSKNARRLLAIPELCDDVQFCLRRDTTDVIAQMNRDGTIRRAN